MKRDFKSELEKIDSVIDQLGSVAGADGKITREEQSLLDEIMDNLSDYRLLVLDALEDDTITEEESKKMQDALDKIVDNASKIALEDGNFTADEEQLIETIITFAEN